MPASPGSGRTVDPKNEGASDENVVAAGINPSSEETLSGSTGYETAPDVLGSIDYSLSSEEIISEHSTASPTPPEVLQFLARDPEGYNIPPNIRQILPSTIPPNTLALSSSYGAKIPSDVSGEVTDESGQVIFERIVAATEKSPDAPNLKVNCIRRIWLQKDPWLSYLWKHRFFFFVSSFLFILAGVLLWCRLYFDLPSLHKLLLTVSSGIVLISRCIFMHLLIPEGPPFKATKFGVRLNKPKPRQKRNSVEPLLQDW